MASEPEDTERDRAVRSLLVHRIQRPAAARGVRLHPDRARVALVTAVVLIAIIALTVVSIRLTGGRPAPAEGGTPTAAPTTEDALPTPTIPAGKLLGRFTSADGPVQTHTIHPNGLAIAARFECAGIGDYSVSISHDSEFASMTPAGQTPGRCAGAGSGGGGPGSREKGHTEPVKVTVKTAKGMTWTLTLVGIPETYVTPRPIPTPTDSTGTAVRYCTAADLTARFAAHAMPDGVTEVRGGELVFTNTTDSTCALAGYPEVRFIDGGTALGSNTMNAVDERSSEEDGLRAVVLRPGGRAYSQIDWYLRNYYPENDEGTCDARTVSSVRVDLAYDLSSPGQTGTLDVPIGTATACLNGEHGALGKYGQISSTVFVPYSLTEGKGE